MTDRPLNPRQEAFVNAYVASGCKSPAEAARKAGYSERTIAQGASQLLKNINVARAIEERRKPAQEAAIVDATFVFTSLRKIVEMGLVEHEKTTMMGKKIKGKDGKPVMRCSDAGNANMALKTLVSALGLGKEKADKDMTIATLAETLQEALNAGK